jgi:hypothetical protein
LRQSPVTFRFGSSVLTEVQQISPLVVLQSVDWLQAFGHFDAGRQMCWL